MELRDDARITGTHTSVLTINYAALSDAGSYDVVVTDACVAAVSRAAALRVLCGGDFDRSGSIEPLDVASFVNQWFSDLLHGGCGG